MQTLNDQELVQLATEPAERLFPLWDRGNEFLPLLVLLMVLPAFYTAQCGHLSEPDANWHLTTLNFYQAQRAIDVALPNPASYPPLGHWLNLLSHWFAQVNPALNELAISVAATAGVTWIVFLFARRFLSIRVAVWLAAFLCVQGSFLSQAQAIPNLPLSLLCMVTTLLVWWIFQQTLRWLFLPLCGVSLALCWYAGGIAVLIPLLVISSDLLVQQFHPILPTKQQSSSFVSRLPVWKRGLCLGAVLLIASIIITPALVSLRERQPVLSAVLKLPAAFGSISAISSISWQTIAGEYLWSHQGWLGLTWLGLWRSRGSYLRILPEPSARILRFVRVWYLLGWSSWFCFLVLSGTPNVQTEALRLFALLPGMFLAAVGIEEICESRLRSTRVLVMTCISILAATGSLLLREGTTSTSTITWALLVPVALVLISVVAWHLEKTHQQSPEKRLIGMQAIVAHLALTLLLAPVTLRQATEADETLWELGRELETLEVTDCTLISSELPPPQLMFWLRKLWPEARFEVGGNWADGLARLPQGTEEGRENTLLFASWEATEIRPGSLNALGYELEEIREPRFFESRQLRIYQLIPRL